jgi:hypothetical protein
MDKIWYIDVNGKSEGPFSIDDLRRDLRITPDTLVWKEGFPSWKPIRKVPELKAVFADEPDPKKPKPADPELPAKAVPPSQSELVLDLKKEPPYFFWFLIIIAAIIYFLTQLFWSRA